MVKVKHLFKKYITGRGEVKAVSGVDFEVAAGEFFTLLGPSGCGKSTTLRCIAGLEKPEGGEIIIGDNIVFSSEQRLFVPGNLRDIAMVFQSYAIWPHMNVYANVAYPLEGKMSKSVIREKVLEVLKMVGIEELSNRPATQLSGGQQQRVAVARAIVKGAKVLLFDEPLSNLDARLRVHMRSEFKSLQRRLGITAIYVTHDQEEALSLSDRVAVMNEGRIVEVGPAARIYNQPKVRFTADFVGSYNLLPGKIVKRGEGGCVAQTELGEIESLSSESAPEDVMIGIRPEHIEVSGEKDLSSKGKNVFRGTVSSALFIGKSRDCVMQVGSRSMRVQLPSSKDVTEGEQIYLYLPPKFCIVLPADSKEGG
jgi:iron(III) transport system ATP-binding protein